MKNWKRAIMFILIGTITLLPNEVNAESASESGFPVKNAFIIVAIAIILLLLYLGYKMDSNENDLDVKKEKGNKKFNNSKIKQKEDFILDDKEYEADISEYEVDNVNPEEIDETIEYQEDDVEIDEDKNFNDLQDVEKSLYEISNESNNLDSTRSFDTSELRKELTLNEEEMDKNYGEEFDISIIDNIDDDLNDKKSTDMEDVEDPFIKELKNFKEPEIEFTGFSVATTSAKQEEPKSTKKEETKQEEPKFTENKEIKKISKKTAEKADNINEAEALNNDFLKQMKKNLELGSNDIEVTEMKNSSKETTTKKASTKKKKTE